MKIKINIYFPVIFFLFIFLIYAVTLAPDTIPEDSGELATAGFSLGIPHPPGYPLYVLLLKLFLFLPFQSVIFRANLFSAFFSALSVLFLFQILFKINKNRLAAFLLSCLFAFSRTFWSQSVIAEIYTLNVVLIIIYLYFIYKTISNKKYLRFIAFLSGLLVVSHYSNVLIILPVGIILILKYKKDLFSFSFLFWGIFPLTLFLVLFIRSQAAPLIDWGNPVNLHKFIIHVLRLSFGSMVSKAPRSFPLILSQVKMFIQIFVFQFGPVLSFGVFVYFLLGLKKLIFSKSYGKEIRLLLILLLIFLSIGIILVLNLKTDEESFFINHVFFIPFILIFIFIINFKKFNKLDFFIYTFIVLLLFARNYALNNRAKEFFTLIYNRDIFKSTAYKCKLFSAKDFSTFPLLYYQKVEYKRPDISIYDWFGNVFKDIFKRGDFHLLPDFKRNAFREQITDKIRLNSTDEVYYTFQRAALNEVKSLGIVYTYNKNHKNFNFNYLNFPVIQTNNLSYLNYFTCNMISVYYFHLGFFYKQEKDNKLSQYYLNLSNKFGGSQAKQYVNLGVNAMKQHNLSEAIHYFEKAISSDDEIDRAYFYIGNIYFQQKHYLKAEKMYLKAIEKNKLNGLAYNNLGNLYLKTGYKEKAKHIFQSGIFTGYGKLYYNLGSLFISENSLENARQYLLDGIKHSSDYVPLYLQLGVVLSKLNNWKEAGLYLEKAYKLNPDDKNVILNLALVYIKIGKISKAKMFLMKGQKKFPQANEFSRYLKALDNIKQ